MPTFQFHDFVASARVPNPQLFLSTTADDDSARRVHGQAVDGVLVAIQGWGCNNKHHSLTLHLQSYTHTHHARPPRDMHQVNILNQSHKMLTGNAKKIFEMTFEVTSYKDKIYLWCLSWCNDDDGDDNSKKCTHWWRCCCWRWVLWGSAHPTGRWPCPAQQRPPAPGPEHRPAPSHSLCGSSVLTCRSPVWDKCYTQ